MSNNRWLHGGYNCVRPLCSTTGCFVAALRAAAGAAGGVRRAEQAVLDRVIPGAPAALPLEETIALACGAAPERGTL